MIRIYLKNWRVESDSMDEAESHAMELATAMRDAGYVVHIDYTSDSPDGNGFTASTELEYDSVHDYCNQ